MDGGRHRPRRARQPLPLPYRALLALPLVYGIISPVLAAAQTFGDPAQAGSSYLLFAWAATAAAYAAAAALVLLGSRHRAAWLVLLACGVALFVVTLVSTFRLGLVDAGPLEYSAYAGLLVHEFLPPLYLTALAAVEIAARTVPPARAGSPKGREDAHVQL